MKIEEKGFLTDFTYKVWNKQLKPKEKLNTAQLRRIATHLGQIEDDPYKVLFETDNHELGGMQSKDLATFVLLDHTRERAWFWQPDGTATTDALMANGTPLMLYGQREQQGKKYSSWLEGLDLNDRASMLRLDMFMPKGLHSLDIDEETGEVGPAKLVGLLLAYRAGWKFSPELVRDLRQDITNYRSVYKPRVSKKISPEYSKLSYYLRCLVLQSWLWSAPCRKDSMIMDILDWDKMPKDLDESFEGLKPNRTMPGLSNWVVGLNEPKFKEELLRKRKPPKENLKI